MIAPPALGMGLAFATSCRAHVPERPPCTVHDFEDDNANPTCVVARPEGIPIYSATPPPDGESDRAPSLGPPPNLFKPRPESAAREIAAAIEGCDLPSLRAAILSHGELSSVARTPPDAATYEETVTRWLATWSLTDCTPSQPTTTPRQPTIKSVVNVPVGAEWKAPLVLASVTLPKLTGAEPPSQITMVDLDGRWRILLR